MRCAGTTADEIRGNRGSHALLFPPEDHPNLLKAAQPQLRWGSVTSGADTVDTLPYHEFVPLIAGAMRITGLGYPGKAFRTSIIDAPCLDRSWKVILAGITDWTPCKPGVFEARVMAAAATSLAAGGALEVLEADFYDVSTFSDAAGTPMEDLAWSKHLTFTPGALVDSSDGTLKVWGDTEYYSDSRIVAAGHSADSALVAYLRQCYEGAIGAMTAAGATSTFVATSCAPRPKRT